MNKDEKSKLALMCFAISARLTLENYPGVQSEQLIGELVYRTIRGLKTHNIVDLIEPQQFLGACGFRPEIRDCLVGMIEDGSVQPSNKRSEATQELLAKVNSWFEIK